eukprot:TRINITY_DN3551_c0_g1_i1.p1 TRINITY_DN3551_c0_g1~~TRINITY_DN3551_c0_g1_i1.p1  ORF type:complete len:702 (-),score=212.18 TRINITY_DN3551_c0_g1_i1:64-2169(-)
MGAGESAFYFFNPRPLRVVAAVQQQQAQVPPLPREERVALLTGSPTGNADGEGEREAGDEATHVRELMQRIAELEHNITVEKEQHQQELEALTERSRKLQAELTGVSRELDNEREAAVQQKLTAGQAEAQLRGRVTACETEKANLKSCICLLQNERTNLQKQVETLTEANGKLKKGAAWMKSEEERLRVQVARLNDEMADATAEADQLRGQLERLSSKRHLKVLASSEEEPEAEKEKEEGAPEQEAELKLSGFDLSGVEERLDALAGTVDSEAELQHTQQQGKQTDFDLSGVEDSFARLGTEQSPLPEDDEDLDFDLAGVDDGLATLNVKSAEKPADVTQEGNLAFDLAGVDDALGALGTQPPQQSPQDNAEATRDLGFDLAGIDEGLAALAEPAKPATDLSFDLTGVNLAQFTAPSPQEGRAEIAGVVRSCGSACDVNASGLRRARKKSVIGKPGVFPMEDEHFCQYPWELYPDGLMLGVFDGFAGNDASRAAKEIFQRDLAQLLKTRGTAADLTSLIHDCFLQVDEHMMEVGNCDYVGSTCTVVLVWHHDGKRYLQAGNVGDSNSFLFRGGHAIALTEEHKVTSAAEVARLQHCGIQVNPGQTRINGVCVSRALGTHFLKRERLGVIAEPHVSPPHMLTEEDTLVVLCSDGIWDVIDGQSACQLMASEPDALAMARKLLQHALRQSHCQDNVTVVVAQL